MASASMPDLYAAVDGAIRGTHSLAHVEHAIAHGAPLDQTTGPVLPLQRAVQAKHVALVDTLLKARASPDAADVKGVRPLHMAVFDGKRNILELLLNAKANVDVKDRHGQTPLFFAPSKSVCEMLLRAKADVNALNDKGQTAMHLAAHAGLEGTITWLAKRMSPGMVNHRDKHGRTAAYLASRMDLSSTVQILKQVGADTSVAPYKAKGHEKEKTHEKGEKGHSETKTKKEGKEHKERSGKSKERKHKKEDKEDRKDRDRDDSHHHHHSRTLGTEEVTVHPPREAGPQTAGAPLVLAPIPGQKVINTELKPTGLPPVPQDAPRSVCEEAQPAEDDTEETEQPGKALAKSAPKGLSEAHLAPPLAYVGSQATPSGAQVTPSAAGASAVKQDTEPADLSRSFSSAPALSTAQDTLAPPTPQQKTLPPVLEVTKEDVELPMPLPSTPAAQAFSFLDSNNDGVVDAQEFAKMFDELPPAAAKAVVAATSKVRTGKAIVDDAAPEETLKAEQTLKLAPAAEPAVAEPVPTAAEPAPVEEPALAEEPAAEEAAQAPPPDVPVEASAEPAAQEPQPVAEAEPSPPAEAAEAAPVEEPSGETEPAVEEEAPEAAVEEPAEPATNAPRAGGVAVETTLAVEAQEEAPVPAATEAPIEAEVPPVAEEEQAPAEVPAELETAAPAEAADQAGEAPAEEPAAEAADPPEVEPAAEEEAPPAGETLTEAPAGEPVLDEPAAELPAAEAAEPASEEPVAEEPVAEAAPEGEPAAVEEPEAAEAPAEEPAAEEPAAEEPVAEAAEAPVEEPEAAEAPAAEVAGAPADVAAEEPMADASPEAEAAAEEATPAEEAADAAPAEEPAAEEPVAEAAPEAEPAAVEAAEVPAEEPEAAEAPAEEPAADPADVAAEEPVADASPEAEPAAEEASPPAEEAADAAPAEEPAAEELAAEEPEAAPEAEPAAVEEPVAEAAPEVELAAEEASQPVEEAAAPAEEPAAEEPVAEEPVAEASPEAESAAVEAAEVPAEEPEAAEAPAEEAPAEPAGAPAEDPAAEEPVAEASPEVQLAAEEASVAPAEEPAAEEPAAEEPVAEGEPAAEEASQPVEEAADAAPAEEPAAEEPAAEEPAAETALEAQPVADPMAALKDMTRGLLEDASKDGRLSSALHKSAPKAAEAAEVPAQEPEAAPAEEPAPEAAEVPAQEPDAAEALTEEPAAEAQPAADPMAELKNMTRGLLEDASKDGRLSSALHKTAPKAAQAVSPEAPAEAPIEAVAAEEPQAVEEDSAPAPEAPAEAPVETAATEEEKSVPVPAEEAPAETPTEPAETQEAAPEEVLAEASVVPSVVPMALAEQTLAEASAEGTVAQLLQPEEPTQAQPVADPMAELKDMTRGLLENASKDGRLSSALHKSAPKAAQAAADAGEEPQAEEEKTVPPLPTEEAPAEAPIESAEAQEAAPEKAPEATVETTCAEPQEEAPAPEAPAEAPVEAAADAGEEPQAEEEKTVPTEEAPAEAPTESAEAQEAAPEEVLAEASADGTVSQVLQAQWERAQVGLPVADAIDVENLPSEVQEKSLEMSAVTQEEGAPHLPGHLLIQELMHAAREAGNLDVVAKELRKKANRNLRKGLHDGTLHDLIRQLYNKSIEGSQSPPRAQSPPPQIITEDVAPEIPMERSMDSSSQGASAAAREMLRAPAPTPAGALTPQDRTVVKETRLSAPASPVGSSVVHGSNASSRPLSRRGLKTPELLHVEYVEAAESLPGEMKEEVGLDDLGLAPGDHTTPLDLLGALARKFDVNELRRALEVIEAVSAGHKLSSHELPFGDATEVLSPKASQVTDTQMPGFDPTSVPASPLEASLESMDVAVVPPVVNILPPSEPDAFPEASKEQDKTLKATIQDDSPEEMLVKDDGMLTPVEESPEEATCEADADTPKEPSGDMSPKRASIAKLAAATVAGTIPGLLGPEEAVAEVPVAAPAEVATAAEPKAVEPQEPPAEEAAPRALAEASLDGSVPPAVATQVLAEASAEEGVVPKAVAVQQQAQPAADPMSELKNMTRGLLEAASKDGRLSSALHRSSPKEDRSSPKEEQAKPAADPMSELKDMTRGLLEAASKDGRLSSALQRSSPKVKQAPCVQGGGMPIADAIDDAECLQLVFSELELHSVDKGEFTKELMDGLRAVDVPEQSLAKLRIELRAGSIIADIWGPLADLDVIRGKPLDNIEVMGCKAKLATGLSPLEEKPTTTQLQEEPAPVTEEAPAPIAPAAEEPAPAPSAEEAAEQALAEASAEGTVPQALATQTLVEASAAGTVSQLLAPAEEAAAQPAPQAGSRPVTPPGVRTPGTAPSQADLESSLAALSALADGGIAKETTQLEMKDQVLRNAEQLEELKAKMQSMEEVLQDPALKEAMARAQEAKSGGGSPAPATPAPEKTEQPAEPAAAPAEEPAVAPTVEEEAAPALAAAEEAKEEAASRPVSVGITGICQAPAEPLEATFGQDQHPLQSVMRSTLDQACKDGNLRKALAKVKADSAARSFAAAQGADASDIADFTRQVLVDSTMDGSLDRMIAAAVQPPELEEEGSVSEDRMSTLLSMTRQALTTAHMDGTLQQAINEANEATLAPGKESDLKVEARELLQQAQLDGSLRKALAKVKAESAERAYAEGAEDGADILGYTRDLLCGSTMDGSLAQVLAANVVPGERAATEEDRLNSLVYMTRQMLTDAHMDGTLLAALQDSEAPEVGSNAEDRMAALTALTRNVLSEAEQEGTLRAVLPHEEYIPDGEGQESQHVRAFTRKLMSDGTLSGVHKLLQTGETEFARVDEEDETEETHDLREVAEMLQGSGSDATRFQPPKEDKLQMYMRDLFSKASADGRLDTALAKVKGVADPKYALEDDVNSVREQTRELLLTSSLNGSLGTLLEEHITEEESSDKFDTTQSFEATGQSAGSAAQQSEDRYGATQDFDATMNTAGVEEESVATQSVGSGRAQEELDEMTADASDEEAEADPEVDEGEEASKLHQQEAEMTLAEASAEGSIPSKLHQQEAEVTLAEASAEGIVPSKLHQQEAEVTLAEASAEGTVPSKLHQQEAVDTLAHESVEGHVQSAMAAEAGEADEAPPPPEDLLPKEGEDAPEDKEEPPQEPPSGPPEGPPEGPDDPQTSAPAPQDIAKESTLLATMEHVKRTAEQVEEMKRKLESLESKVGNEESDKAVISLAELSAAGGLPDAVAEFRRGELKHFVRDLFEDASKDDTLMNAIATAKSQASGSRPGTTGSNPLLKTQPLEDWMLPASSEDLIKQNMKATLEDAQADGRLAKVLEARAKARQGAHKEAAGSLGPAAPFEAPAPESEAATQTREAENTMKANLREVLENASMDGRLTDALGKLRSAEEAAAAAAPEDRAAKERELKTAMRNLLEGAAEDGSLSDAMAAVRSLPGTRPQTADEGESKLPALEEERDVKHVARDMLLRANRAGRLGDILAKSWVSAGEPQALPESLRNKVRGMLSTSQKDGRLESALASAQSQAKMLQLQGDALGLLATSSVEGTIPKQLEELRAAEEQAEGDLRRRMREALMSAHVEGTLPQAENDAEGKLPLVEPAAEQEAREEELKARMRDSLVAANENGSLAKHLVDTAAQKAQAEQSKRSELEEAKRETMKQQLKSSLVNAFNNGSLVRALAPPEEVAAARKTFNRFDLNQDGTIDAEEFTFMHKVMEEEMREKMRQEAMEAVAAMHSAVHTNEMGTQAETTEMGTQAEEQAEEEQGRFFEPCPLCNKDFTMSSKFCRECGHKRPGIVASQAPETSSADMAEAEMSSLFISIGPDGGLLEALEEEPEEVKKSQEMDALKSNVLQSLESAAKDGRLNQALGRCRAQPSPASPAHEELPDTGAEALEEVKGEVEEPVSPTSTGGGEDYERYLKGFARNVLETAKADGRLCAALAKARGVSEQAPPPPPAESSKPAEGNNIKEMTKSVIVAGLRDGRLAEALSSAQAEKPKKPKEDDKLKDMTKSTLVAGLRDGRLAEALSGPQAEKPKEDDKLKDMTKSTLIAGLRDGRLAEALSGPQAEKPKEDDKLKDMTKSALVAGLRDGRLAEALSGPQAEKPKDPPKADLEQIKSMTRGTLEGACKDGRLKSVLGANPQQVVNRFDKNKDGILDAQEYAEMRRVLKEEMKEEMKRKMQAEAQAKLQTQMRELFEGAAMDGRLDQALAKVKTPAEAKLQAQMRELFEGAAMDGRLDQALSKVKTPPSKAGSLKLLTRDVLRSAAKDGRLHEALCQHKVQEGSMTLTEEEIDRLRLAARGTLLNAQGDGRLGEAVNHCREAVSRPGSSELRKSAFARLESALADGSLEATLEAVQRKRELEALRKSAGEKLREAQAESRLGEILESALCTEGPVEEEEYDSFKESMREDMMNSLLAGTLTDALAGVPADTLSEDEEALKQRTRALMETANKSGALSEVLGRLSRPSSRDPKADLEQIKSMTRGVLEGACKDGRLKSVLEAKRQQEPLRDIRLDTRAVLMEAAMNGRLAEELSRRPKPAAQEKAVDELGHASAEGRVPGALGAQSQERRPSKVIVQDPDAEPAEDVDAPISPVVRINTDFSQIDISRPQTADQKEAASDDDEREIAYEAESFVERLSRSAVEEGGEGSVVDLEVLDDPDKSGISEPVLDAAAEATGKDGFGDLQGEQSEVDALKARARQLLSDACSNELQIGLIFYEMWKDKGDEVPRPETPENVRATYQMAWQTLEECNDNGRLRDVVDALQAEVEAGRPLTATSLGQSSVQQLAMASASGGLPGLLAKEGGMPVADAIDDLDRLELTFSELKLQDVNQVQFKTELMHGLRELDVPDKTLAKLRIELRAGSVIADIFGPTADIDVIRGKPLHNIEVMGCKAKHSAGFSWQEEKFDVTRRQGADSTQATRFADTSLPAFSDMASTSRWGDTTRLIGSEMGDTAGNLKTQNLSGTAIREETEDEAQGVPGMAMLGALKRRVKRSRSPAPIQVIEGGVKRFEVHLVKKDKTEKFGFSHSNGTTAFIKRRGKGEDGPKQLFVKGIKPSLLLDSWNQTHPELAVQVGDRIVAVNGKRNIDNMYKELVAAPEVTLNVSRWGEFFTLRIPERAADRKLGMRFGKAVSDAEPSRVGIRITDLGNDGLMEELNDYNIAKGRWYAVVMPGMWIHSANDVTDATAISQLLRDGAAVTLCFRRADVDRNPNAEVPISWSRPSSRRSVRSSLSGRQISFADEKAPEEASASAAPKEAEAAAAPAAAKPEPSPEESRDKEASADRTQATGVGIGGSAPQVVVAATGEGSSLLSSGQQAELSVPFINVVPPPLTPSDGKLEYSVSESAPGSSPAAPQAREDRVLQALANLSISGGLRPAPQPTPEEKAVDELGHASAEGRVPGALGAQSQERGLGALASASVQGAVVPSAMSGLAKERGLGALASASVQGAVVPSAMSGLAQDRALGSLASATVQGKVVPALDAVAQAKLQTQMRMMFEGAAMDGRLDQALAKVKTAPKALPPPAVPAAQERRPSKLIVQHPDAEPAEEVDAPISPTVRVAADFANLARTTTAEMQQEEEVDAPISPKMRVAADFANLARPAAAEMRQEEEVDAPISPKVRVAADFANLARPAAAEMRQEEEVDAPISPKVRVAADFANLARPAAAEMQQEAVVAPAVPPSPEEMKTFQFADSNQDGGIDVNELASMQQQMEEELRQQIMLEMMEEQAAASQPTSPAAASSQPPTPASPPIPPPPMEDVEPPVEKLAPPPVAEEPVAAAPVTPKGQALHALAHASADDMVATAMGEVRKEHAVETLAHASADGEVAQAVPQQRQERRPSKILVQYPDAEPAEDVDAPISPAVRINADFSNIVRPAAADSSIARPDAAEMQQEEAAAAPVSPKAQARIALAHASADGQVAQAVQQQHQAQAFSALAHASADGQVAQVVSLQHQEQAVGELGHASAEGRVPDAMGVQAKEVTAAFAAPIYVPQDQADQSMSMTMPAVAETPTDVGIHETTAGIHETTAGVVVSAPASLEASATMDSVHPPALETPPAQAFNRFDLNKDGVIDNEEFEKMQQVLLSEQAAAMAAAAPKASPKAAPMPNVPEETKERCPGCGSCFMSDSKFCRECGTRRPDSPITTAQSRTAPAAIAAAVAGAAVAGAAAEAPSMPAVPEAAPVVPEGEPDSPVAEPPSAEPEQSFAAPEADVAAAASVGPTHSEEPASPPAVPPPAETPTASDKVGSLAAASAAGLVPAQEPAAAAPAAKPQAPKPPPPPAPLPEEPKRPEIKKPPKRLTVHTNHPAVKKSTVRALKVQRELGVATAGTPGPLCEDVGATEKLSKEDRMQHRALRLPRSERKRQRSRSTDVSRSGLTSEVASSAGDVPSLENTTRPGALQMVEEEAGVGGASSSSQDPAPQLAPEPVFVPKTQKEVQEHIAKEQAAMAIQEMKETGAAQWAGLPGPVFRAEKKKPKKGGLLSVFGFGRKRRR